MWLQLRSNLLSVCPCCTINILVVEEFLFQWVPGSCFLSLVGAGQLLFTLFSLPPKELTEQRATRLS